VGPRRGKEGRGLFFFHRGGRGIILDFLGAQEGGGKRESPDHMTIIKKKKKTSPLRITTTKRRGGGPRPLLPYDSRMGKKETQREDAVPLLSLKGRKELNGRKLGLAGGDRRGKRGPFLL